MNDVPIQIRNPEVVRAIRALAEQTRQPITEAVGDAVRDALRRRDVASNAETQRRLAVIDALVEQFQALPIVGPLMTDDDLYDEDGLPK